MRVLILSANTGSGHNSSAEALAEQFAKLNIGCEIMDSLSFISEKLSKRISWWHSYFNRNLPGLFGQIYRYEERHPTKFIYEQCAKGAEHLQEKLLSEHFDAVVCVHVFPCMMMAEIRRRFGTAIPHYFVATAYTCAPGVSELNADAYFIPHRMLFSEFVRGLVPADKMFATGIPVREAFYQAVDKSATRRELGLPENRHLVLMSGGSLGVGHLKKNALKFVKKLPESVSLVVLCGKNEKLYAGLEPYHSERLMVIGYNDQIPLYMSAADIYLTKPGGLMTTEAIAKRLPMVLVDAVPGSDTRNYHFLAQHGVATQAKTWRQAMSLIPGLLEDPDALEKQRSQMDLFQPPSAAEQICRAILRREMETH